MTNVEKFGYEDDYRENRVLDLAAEYKLYVLSLSKGELFLEHAGFRMQVMLPDIYSLIMLTLGITSTLEYRNG